LFTNQHYICAPRTKVETVFIGKNAGSRTADQVTSRRSENSSS